MMRLLVSMLKASLLVVLLLGAGCGPGQKKETKTVLEGQRKETKTVLDQRMGQLDELRTKRENRLKQLKAMDVAQLARELAADSERGLEPFNSMAFAETVSRGQDMGLRLKPLLTQPDHKSLLGLLALRKASPTQYQALDPAFKVRVLTDALSTSRYFNKWGLPHLYWEDAAKTLIGEGEAAEKPLIALLKDTREAPMWGSEEVQEYEKYKYRVRDYAWAMLNEIKGRKVAIPTDPAQRDKLIAAVSGQGGAN